MEKKLCHNCGHTVWHNPLGAKNVGSRCTKCAYPLGTGPKKERNESLSRTALKQK